MKGSVKAKLARLYEWCRCRRPGLMAHSHMTTQKRKEIDREHTKVTLSSDTIYRIPAPNRTPRMRNRCALCSMFRLHSDVSIWCSIYLCCSCPSTRYLIVTHFPNQLCRRCHPDCKRFYLENSPHRNRIMETHHLSQIPVENWEEIEERKTESREEEREREKKKSENRTN